MRALFKILRRIVKAGRGRFAATKAVIEEELQIIRKIARNYRPRTEEELYKIYRSVFMDEGGQAVIQDLCKRFHIAGSTRGEYDPPECRDSEEIRRGGERDVVLYILERIHTPIVEEENPAKAG